MAQSQSGGNKKRPSPSDVNYQARRKAGGRSQINKDRAHKRHNLRHGLPANYKGNLVTPSGPAHPGGTKRKEKTEYSRVMTQR